MSRFSPSVLRCLGVATIEASMIWPLIAGGWALTNDSSRLADMRVWLDEERHRGPVWSGRGEWLEGVTGSGNSPQKPVWRARIALAGALHGRRG